MLVTSGRERKNYTPDDLITTLRGNYTEGDNLHYFKHTAAREALELLVNPDSEELPPITDEERSLFCNVLTFIKRTESHRGRLDVSFLEQEKVIARALLAYANVHARKKCLEDLLNEE